MIANTRVIKVSNILCFASVTMNKLRAECNVVLRTQISHEVLSHTFTKITERFDPWEEIESHLKIISIKGAELRLEYVHYRDEKFVSS